MCDSRETTVESLRNQLIGGVSMNLITISLKRRVPKAGLMTGVKS